MDFFNSHAEVHVPSEGTAILSISILEGVQYHMGKLEIFAQKEAAESLLSKWELPEGAVFDRTYLDKYIGSNRSLLPPEFQREHVQIVRDCPDATVDVRLPLDAMDPRSQSLPKDSECGSPDNSSKQAREKRISEYCLSRVKRLGLPRAGTLFPIVYPLFALARGLALLAGRGTFGCQW
jgi:hypothetical protein